jgi:four helix bundle protein
MSKSIIGPKSIAFAIRIIKLYKYLCQHQKEFVLSKQLLRSGTSIGALIREAEHAQSKADFLHKMNISLKEANESEYWLFLLREGVYLQDDEYNSIQKDCDELIKLLVSIVKTTKLNLNKVVK